MVKIHSQCSRGQGFSVCAILTRMNFSLLLDITASCRKEIFDFMDVKIAGCNYVINLCSVCGLLVPYESPMAKSWDSVEIPDRRLHLKMEIVLTACCFNDLSYS